MFTNVTLLYFLLLIPLSGFIAWLGDRIGHKSGKRRHTLFGLRPRHTAMVFTVGTGMCISLVSFALMYGLSSEFRSVISDGFRLYSANRQLQQSNETLTQGNVQLTKIADQRKQDADRADQKRSEAIEAEKRADANAKNAAEAEHRAVTEQNKAEAELTQAKNRLTMETQSLQSVKGSLRNVQGSLRSAQGTLKERSARLADANKRVAQAQNQVNDAVARVQLAHGNAGRAQAEAQQAQHVAQVAKEVIDQQKQTLDEQKQALAALHQQYDSQTRLFDDQKKATDGQRTELARLNTQVADGEATLRQIKSDTEALRAKGITYQVNEEVARVAIKPGYNVWRLEGILSAFLTDAARKAEARGASKRSGGSALVIPPPNGIVEANSDGSGKKAALQEQKQMDATITGAAEMIRSKNTDVLVVVSSVANAVKGEPVTVTLKLSLNPIVFPADAQIGDVRIDGNASPVAIDEAFRTFLNTDLRYKLLHAGVIPKLSGGLDPDTSLSLGGVTPDDWLHIMDRIRLAGDNARVVVTASQDMRAGDIPVPLHFDVKGVPNSAYRTSAW